MPSNSATLPRRSLIGLNAANFFQAEMVGVIMPILNAFLKQAGWQYDAIGFATAAAGLGTLLFPHPLPTSDGLSKMPWWAPLGGLVGAVQVYAGLTLVQKVGAGPFVGLTVTAAPIMSLFLDHYGWFHMPVHAMNPWRVAGAVLMVGGIGLIARH